MGSSYFREVHKTCKQCGATLTLNNSRDIARKNFCNRVCKGLFYGPLRDVSYLLNYNNTPEANAKKVHRGALHPKYVADRSKIKGRPRPEKSEWRSSVFQRDAYTCVECGVVGGQLQAHHKAPYELFPNLRNEPDNGITVCRPCHKLMHKAAVELFGAVHRKSNRRIYADAF